MVRACAILMFAFPLAAVQSGPAGLAGSVLDPSGAPVGGVSLLLTNGRTLAKHQVKADEAGRFDFGELPPGEYLLEGQVSGFPPISRTISLASGQRIQRDLTLDVPGVSIRTTVLPPPDNPQPRVPYPPDWSCLPDSPTLCGPPSLLKEFERDEEVIVETRDRARMAPARWILRPGDLQYPESLRGSGISGVVIIEGRVGTDGFPTALRVASAEHPDLGAAALQGVADWRFIPARLNGVLIDVPLTATIEFAAKR